jgi:hypothetical protein
VTTGCSKIAAAVLAVLHVDVERAAGPNHVRII